METMYYAVTCDLEFDAYAEAVEYLENRLGDHHMKVKAGMRRIAKKLFKGPSGDQSMQLRTIRALLSLSDEQEGIARNFTIMVINQYLLAILKTWRGSQSMIESGKFGPVLLKRSMDIPFEVSDVLQKVPEFARCKVHRRVLETTRQVCIEISELYQGLYSPDWAKAKAKEAVEVYKEELIARTCHPTRVRWFLDALEYHEIFGELAA